MQKEKRILAAMAMLMVIVLVGMIAAFRYANQHTFEKPSFDSSAKTGTPDVEKDLGYSELNAQSYKVSLCGKLIEAEQTVDVYLTNPDTNAVWLKLRIYDKQGNILGETGLARPGEYIQSLELNKPLSGNTDVVLKIMSYEPDTYYSAGSVTLNTTMTKGGMTQ